CTIWAAPQDSATADQSRHAAAAHLARCPLRPRPTALRVPNSTAELSALARAALLWSSGAGGLLRR
ncbi:MAG: hypothetical protein ACRDRB_22380, partial [Pseudonocardiaceae bacterium]